MPWWGWLIIGVLVGMPLAGGLFVVYMAKLFEEGDNPRSKRRRK